MAECAVKIAAIKSIIKIHFAVEETARTKVQQ
jgi:hypothetical protein